LKVHTTLGIADFAGPIREDTSSSIRRSHIVVTGFAILTPDDFITIANAVAIRVLKVHTTLGIADLAVPIREDTSSSIRRSHIVVARVAVLASDDLIVITNPVAICVLNIHAALRIADFAGPVSEDTSSSFCCGRVIIARVAVLASDDFVTVTNAVAICV
jgi:hypothetical protein